MATNKAKRSNPLAQPQRRSPNPQPRGSQINDPQVKSKLFEALRHLNRGFGVALAALDRLQRLDRLQKPCIFPLHCLPDFRNRTEELRALANRDLLRLFAGREDHDAELFGSLRTQPDKPLTNSRRHQ
ncbi:MAG: hypothetical protein LAO78_12625 [Acidobacteriia bacterium]|nr:hypothetical protein [Terriglobia bacterium]